MASESSKPKVTFLNGRRHHNYGFPPEAFDYTRLPDVDREFLPPEHLAAFASALSAPDPNHSPNDTTSLLSPTRSLNSLDITRSGSVASVDSPIPESATTQNGSQSSMFITAQNDWAPVNQKVTKHGRKKRRKKTALGRRTVDETREGHLYGLLKWPFLFFVGMWIIGLGASYLWTRLYIFLYEHFIAWRGTRERLRRNMRATSSYRDWVKAAKEMDAFLGNQNWKEENEYAYYDSKTVRRVWEQLRKHRRAAETQEAKRTGASGYQNGRAPGDGDSRKAVEELKALTEACVKNNFVGVENPRLYSQTYYGTKNLVQNFIDEGLSPDLKSVMFKDIAELTTSLSGEKHAFSGPYGSNTLRRETCAVQANARKLRTNRSVSIWRRCFRILPFWGRQSTTRGRFGARCDHRY